MTTNTETVTFPETHDCYDQSACPECGGGDESLNVGPHHWNVCHKCKTKWWFGFNVFSAWRDEPEDLHRLNAELLETYREVKAIYPLPLA